MMNQYQLISTAQPVFALVLNSIKSPAVVNYDDLRQQVLLALQQFTRDAAAANTVTEANAAARYALIAWVDELLMTHDWSGQAKWAQAPLQMQYYSEHIAGEGFFDRLHHYLNGAKLRDQVLPVFAMCLFLGFKGLYRTRSDSELQQLIARIQQALQVTATKPTAENTDEQSAQSTTKSFAILSKLSPRKCLLISLVSAFCLYLMSDWAVYSATSKQLSQLPSQQRVLS